MHFSELNLSQEVLKVIEEMGFTEPTEIQLKSIPLLMEGKDVIGRSHTGTGKTAAFGIPAIESISRTERRGVEVLIMCPTRELAMQACSELIRFSKFMPWVKPCAVYGGASMEKQINELKRGANLVVGTPGRLMDHISRRTLKLDTVRTVILDEADEMLNMGFREDIEEILKSVPEERQTVLFSATMPPAIMAITKAFQKNPEIIKVENAQRTVAAIEQYFYEVPMGRKLDALVLLLSMYEPKLSMIFCNTKKMVDELTEALNTKGFKASGIHGDMKQMARTQVMERFKSGKTPILIATDVAARGIDVDNIDAVFNFDIPQDNEYYIHRIGRTARAGKTGTAFTLTSGRKQVYEMREIQQFIKAEISLKALPSAADIKKKKLTRFSDKLYKAIEEKKHEEYIHMLEELTNETVTVEMIAAALLSMQLGKEIKTIPSFDQSVMRGKVSTDRPARGDKTCKIVLSVGRQQRIAPNFVLGALVDATGLAGSNFGKIDIYDKHTTVEIPEASKDHIVDSMNNGKINGNVVTAKLLENSEGVRHDSHNDRGGDRGSRGGYKGRTSSSSRFEDKGARGSSSYNKGTGTGHYAPKRASQSKKTVIS